MAQQVHIAMVPLSAPGHFIPMVDMAKLLAQHGATVTLITTPQIASRFAPAIDRVTQGESGLSICVRHIRFPSQEAGLPEGCETVDALPYTDMMKNLLVALAMLQEPFEELFESIKPKPSFLIADMYLSWVAETARKFKVPRIIFDGTSCFNMLCSHNLSTSGVHEDLGDSEPFLVPGLPHKIEFTKAQLPKTLNPTSKESKEFCDRVSEAAAEAYGEVINSFEELEPRYIQEIKRVKGDKVWCIGPLSLCNKDNTDKAHRGNKSSIDEHKCLSWLDEQEPGSVVYACLGSISRLSLPQLMELGSALEASKYPFVWVVRGGEITDEIWKWMEEDGFQERTKGRGLVIRGWAPQVLILSHPSVGAFLTHCGWNSTLEGVSAGLPMVTWPIFAEQFLNEKLAVEVLEIGVSVGAQVAVNLGDEEKFGVVVKREEIRGAVEKVMEKGVEGEKRRQRAKGLKEMAKRAMEKEGSSYLNMELLIEDARKQ
ncbi:UDP-glycosyltransferase 73C4-like isoform X1 [Diospyros lotus]|uniref:UDP-glycosyltransferase 73C4-like isoform X1 n=1 Tax=Diospyros lotus TaxID=55363 RepID=UPI00224D8E94|nr:UDP-glycosyltransferase 73C4-like isoform X1 [Diospyros lotus]